MMALSLLRGPMGPDPVSDQEEHRFTYALFPHSADWREAMTHRQALDLNVPCQAVPVDEHGGHLPPVHSFLEVDSAAVSLEAVKRAESGKGLILRLVERHGARSEVRV